MRLVMLVHEGPEDVAAREDPARAAAFWGAWAAYVRAIREAGVSVGGEGLRPPATATSVRVRDGRAIVQDGPYADSTEQLAGFFVLEVPTMEVARDWAARCPAAANGTVELRPVESPPG